MRWIQGIKKRVLKKRLNGRVHWDGVHFSFDQWQECLAEVLKLRPGEQIINPYKKEWTAIQSIQIEWSGLSGLRGTFISGFYINTVDGYVIYDPPSALVEHYPDLGKSSA